MTDVKTPIQVQEEIKKIIEMTNASTPKGFEHMFPADAYAKLRQVKRSKKKDGTETSPYSIIINHPEWWREIKKWWHLQARLEAKDSA